MESETKKDSMNHYEKLSCMCFNARSIVNKREELELYLSEQDLDIVGITETWLNMIYQIRSLALVDTVFCGMIEKVLIRRGEEGLHF